MKVVIYHPDIDAEIQRGIEDGRLPLPAEDWQYQPNPMCPAGKAYVIDRDVIDEAIPKTFTFRFEPDERTYCQRWLDGEMPLWMAAMLARRSKNPEDRVWGEFAYDQVIADQIARPVSIKRITSV